MILIISSISLLQTTKVIPFLATYDCLFYIFFWITPFISDTDVIVAKSAKTFLAEKQELSSVDLQISLTKHQEIQLVEWF